MCPAHTSISAINLNQGINNNLLTNIKYISLIKVIALVKLHVIFKLNVLREKIILYTMHVFELYTASLISSLRIMVVESKKKYTFGLYYRKVP